jgi:hypothetical protein
MLQQRQAGDTNTSELQMPSLASLSLSRVDAETTSDCKMAS